MKEHRCVEQDAARNRSSSSHDELGDENENDAKAAMAAGMMSAARVKSHRFLSALLSRGMTTRSKTVSDGDSFLECGPFAALATMRKGRGRSNSRKHARDLPRAHQTA